MSLLSKIRKNQELLMAIAPFLYHFLQQPLYERHKCLNNGDVLVLMVL
jgi:hypothetical protein